MRARRPGARPRGAWLWTPVTSVAELLRTLMKARMGWMVPVVLVLLALAALLAALGAAGPLAPFVYPLL